MSDYTPSTERVRADYAETYEGTDEKRYARFDRWLAEVKARTLEDAADDLHISFSRGAAIAMHHQCHKKQCRCGNPGNDEIVRAVFDAAREELRARAAEIREGRNE